jgi:quercetin dioxygenase-like cupin family protein
VTSRHLVGRAAEADYAPPSGWAAASTGYRRWTIVGETAGAVHTGFAICELEPGGSVPTHVHSFEESFHVLDGNAAVDTSEGAFLVPGRLRPDSLSRLHTPGATRATS